MNEKLKKALAELCKAVLSALVGFITALLTTSCGTTRATIVNRADATSTELKITTNNPTTVNVDPNTSITLSK